MKEYGKGYVIDDITKYSNKRLSELHGIGMRFLLLSLKHIAEFCVNFDWRTLKGRSKFRKNKYYFSWVMEGEEKTQEEKDAIAYYHSPEGFRERVLKL